MQITWPDINGNMVTGRIDAALWPYVETLGIDAAARLFLNFGGSYVYIPSKRVTCGKRSEVATKLAVALGPEGMLRSLDLPMAGRANRIPLAHVFLARYLRARGKNINQIAARLRKTDTSIRGMLQPDAQRREAAARQTERVRAEILRDAGVEP